MTARKLDRQQQSSDACHDTGRSRDVMTSKNIVMPHEAQASGRMQASTTSLPRVYLPLGRNPRGDIPPAAHATTYTSALDLRWIPPTYHVTSEPHMTSEPNVTSKRHAATAAISSRRHVICGPHAVTPAKTDDDGDDGGHVTARILPKISDDRVASENTINDKDYFHETENGCSGKSGRDIAVFRGYEISPNNAVDCRDCSAMKGRGGDSSSFSPPSSQRLSSEINRNGLYTDNNNVQMISHQKIVANSRNGQTVSPQKIVGSSRTKTTAANWSKLFSTAFLSPPHHDQEPLLLKRARSHQTLTTTCAGVKSSHSEQHQKQPASAPVEHLTVHYPGDANRRGVDGPSLPPLLTGCSRSAPRDVCLRPTVVRSSRQAKSHSPTPAAGRLKEAARAVAKSAGRPAEYLADDANSTEQLEFEEQMERIREWVQDVNRLAERPPSPGEVEEVEEEKEEGEEERKTKRDTAIYIVYDGD